jgi:hypothetical protein
MREVLVPTRSAAQSCRRAIVLIATWLVVLQAFLAGVAIAQAAAVQVSPGAIGTICHGAGSAAEADGTAREGAGMAHLCCACCTSAAAAVVPQAVPHPARVRHVPVSVVFTSFIFVISPGAIRAGPSQAPPRLA